MKRCFIGILMIIGGLAAFSAPMDSVGIERIDGKVFVVHKVELGETLYSLSRRYNTPIPLILEHNRNAKSGLEVNDTLRIPHGGRARRAGNVQFHSVKAGETLFFISRLYDVTVDELKEWNNLDSNSLNIDQELRVKESKAPPREYQITEPPPEYHPDNENFKYHVVEPKETLFAISRKYDVTVDQLRDWNKMDSYEINIGQQLIVGEVIAGDEEQDTGVTTRRNEKEREKDETEEKEKKEKKEKVKEEVVYLNSDHTRKHYPIKTDSQGFTTRVDNGLAEVIEGTDDTRKYLALHPTLPVGTILMVRNEMNDKIVFVRVLGRLPDTGANQNIVIKLSKAAYDRLGGVGKRFRVELTYIPLEDQG